MSIDGSVYLGDVNGGQGQTPWNVSSVLESGSLINGAALLPFFQQGGVFDDIAYVEGSIDGPVVLPTFDVQASGFVGSVLDTPPLGLTLPLFDVSAGDGGVSLPLFDVQAAGFASALVTGDATLMAFASSGSLEPPLALPLLDVQAVGFAGALAVGDVTLPVFSVAATYGTQANAVLELFDVQAQGLSGAIASGDVRLLSFAADADAYQNNTADGSVTLALFSVDASSDSTAHIDGSVTLMPFDVVAASIAGGSADAELTLPLFAVDASGYMSNVGTATIVLPAFVIGGESNASGGGAGVPVVLNPPPAPVAGVPRTVVLNTRLKAITLYDNLRANSFATFQGVTLAATEQGIVALVGDTDLGTAIEAHVTSGVSDLNVPSMKQVLTGYVGYRSDDEMELTLITDEHHEYSYLLSPMQHGGVIHSSRVKFGRGVTGRYWQWRLANRKGASFDLSHIEFHVQPHKRGV
jgi:hypothetical protein